MKKKLIIGICILGLATQALPTSTLAKTIKKKIEEKKLNNEKDSQAPEILGVEDKDIYVGEKFNAEEDVTYSSKDGSAVTSNISGDVVNTQVVGEYWVRYTATDTKGRTTEVKRKITVRPLLYKNMFRIFSDLGVDDENEGQPTFEIGFDTVTKKYKVFNPRDVKLSEANPNDIAFIIEVRNKYGEIKKKVILKGEDKGTSSDLLDLNNYEYELGDIVRVYRSNPEYIELTGDVEGDIPDIQDIETDEQKLEYMKSAGFVVTNAGLQAKYNKAPEIEGVQETKTISKGIKNVLEGVSVSDDIDQDISVNSMKIYVKGTLMEVKDGVCNYNFDKDGVYDVEYKISDSWGRETVKKSIITVK